MGLKPVSGIIIFRVPKNDDAGNNKPPAIDQPPVK